MRKILSFAVLVSFLVACNNKKEDEKKSTTTDSTGSSTTTPSTTTTTTEPAATETTSGVKADVQFADPEVQKVADAYTVFIETYKGGTTLDRKQAKDYVKELKDWNVRIGDVTSKLASNPSEAQKWTEWAKRLAAKYQVKVNK